ncbi:MAG: UPF0182 family protein [Acidimicrobiales bacterium]
MRPQPDQPRRPSRRERKAVRRSTGRGRTILIAVLAIAVVLLMSLRGIASFYTDYLWFRSIGRSQVWSQMLTTKAVLTLIGGVTFFVLCWGNLLIAERLAPVFRPSSGDDDLIERYHEAVGRRAWLVRLLVALFMALIVGVSLGTAWNEWLLYANRVSFGQQDATFHTDIGFYVFQLPFLTAFSSWLFSSLVVIFAITVLAHVVNGGIRFHTQLDRVTPQVKAHLSVLLGLLALVQVGRYWLSRYELTFSVRGTVDGATYTDANVKLRAIYLLMLIALFAFGLFIANIWRRGWVLPVLAVGLWALVGVVAGVMVPALVQRVRVQPTESSRERPYIVNNIEATRDAYGLGGVETLDYDWTARLSAGALADNLGTMANIRLWDPATMASSFQTKQEFKSFYEITDVDVDRYSVDGKMTPVMIAARDLDSSGIQDPTWESTHLTYTHGYGVVAAAANDQTTPSGNPKLLAKDIPVTVSSDGLPKITEGRIYFGENKTGYVIVNADGQEPTARDEATKYTGQDGVTLGDGASGFLRKAAFSLRFGDIDPMVSASITPESRVIMQRDVRARLDAVAPFLAYDHDPYMVISKGGRLKFVVDAYTTTRNYPNAQRADTGGLDSSSGLYARSFNYARNSVKAVVDAYDGTVHLYVVDAKDPLIRAYQKAFPGMFEPADRIPASIRPHLRYPEDLFTVQTQMWAKYHVDDPVDFYNSRDAWGVPEAVGTKQKSSAGPISLGPDGQKLTTGDRYPAQYTLMQLPDQDQASFVLMRPYVNAQDTGAGSSQNQMRAFIVASSDPRTYGQLRTYVVAGTDLPGGPQTAAADMAADSAVANEVKSQCTDKTVCTFTSPVIVPVGDSLLYVQSFMVQGTKEGAPQVKHVIVNYRRPDGESPVAIDTTLYGALVQLFGDRVPTQISGGATEAPIVNPTIPEGSGSGTGELSQQESDLIDQLVQAFDDADDAARRGDQVGYAENIEKAQQLAERLQELRAKARREQKDSTGTTRNGASSSSSSSTTTTTTSVPPTTTTTAATTTTTSAGA